MNDRGKKGRRDLDRTDRQILRILQQEGRISFTELGERVNRCCRFRL